MVKVKNLLIYAHYYFPDVASTGQIITDLAEGMKDEFNITVICVVPSYTGVIEDKYKKYKYYEEEINKIKIIRVRVPEFNKTKKMSRIKNILTYFFRALWITLKTEKQDYIFAISQPPILGGVLGVIGKWIKHAKYIYNIQDFNPEQAIVVDYIRNKCLEKLLMEIDKFSCKKADKIIVVGHDMIKTLNMRFKEKSFPSHCYINNWINENDIYPLPENDQNVIKFKRKYGLENKIIIMYSGNIGLYYNLENLLKIIEKFKNNNKVSFVFVGDGSEKSKLIDYKKNHHMDNVVFIPYQNKKNLIYSLNAGDIHWVVNTKGIKGISVPSKLYGIMAVGKPILGALEKESEAWVIIEKARCGLLAESDNDWMIEKNINKFIKTIGQQERLNFGYNGRNYLINNLTKKSSILKYIKQIKEC